jgi:hypothetical protein
MVALLGLLAFVLAALFVVVAALYFQEKRNLQAVNEENAHLQEQTEKALARYQPIADLERYKAELETKLNNIRAFLPRFQKLAEMEQYKEQWLKGRGWW